MKTARKQEILAIADLKERSEKVLMFIESQLDVVDVEKKIRELDLDGVVHIIDDCKDIGSAYMLTDLVISASLKPEAFGRVVGEAQAMGRPVVAPNHGAASEIIKKDVTGWLFKPGQAISLAESIEKALSISQVETEKLASIARNNIKEKFTISQMVDSTLDIYENTIKNYNK